MGKIFYWLGRLYVKAPFPIYVSVLLTLGVVLLVLYWIIF
jgi:hypothetical protein